MTSEYRQTTKSRQGTATSSDVTMSRNGTETLKCREINNITRRQDATEIISIRRCRFVSNGNAVRRRDVDVSRDANRPETSKTVELHGRHKHRGCCRQNRRASRRRREKKGRKR